MTLLEISYEMIANLFRHFNAVCKSGATERSGSGSNVLTFLEFHYAKRTINTIVAIGVGLLFGPSTLRMDSLGTHLVENTIGIARSTSQDPRWSVILSSFPKAELRKQLAN